MAKVFQVLNGFVHWQSPYQSITETEGRYAPDIMFVELPDDTKVREGWGYDEETETFIKPNPPEGWEYDEDTGTFYPIGEQPVPPKSVDQEKAEMAETILALKQRIKELEGGK